MPDFVFERSSASFQSILARSRDLMTSDLTDKSKISCRRAVTMEPQLAERVPGMKSGNNTSRNGIRRLSHWTNPRVPRTQPWGCWQLTYNPKYHLGRLYRNIMMNTCCRHPNHDFGPKWKTSLRHPRTTVLAEPRNPILALHSASRGMWEKAI